MDDPPRRIILEDASPIQPLYSSHDPCRGNQACDRHDTWRPGFGPQFVVSRDGQRFLVNTEVPTTEAGRISVVFNWRALLAGR